MNLFISVIFEDIYDKFDFQLSLIEIHMEFIHRFPQENKD
jgi:hypothetical protein